MSQTKQKTLDYFVIKTDDHVSSSQPPQAAASEDTSSTCHDSGQSPQSESEAKETASVAVSVSPFDICHAVRNYNILTDAEKINLKNKCWKPDSLHMFDIQTFGSSKKRSISFQARWLETRKWLCYSSHEDYKGGWCLSCVLFLSKEEKEHLGAFVTLPFRNYNKSTELLNDHERKQYHHLSMDRASSIQRHLSNVELRIDTQLSDMAKKNVESNTSILPHIVDPVLLCAKQQIGLRGHRDDKIDFSKDPVQNEGNFIALMRLLAEKVPVLKDHLTSGARNARYTSKTVQNEIIHVTADLIREFFQRCLQDNPHFSLIADETTSHGQEILSVCLRLLDSISDPAKPRKHEVLIDLCPLKRTTGSHIAEAIRECLKKHKISLDLCRGQAYDTTASMSSDKKGVQAEIGKYAPDAEYQGCCLHSLNLAICHSCKLPQIQNMMDACRELYSFFDNSPKRQSFLEDIIGALSPETKKRKLKNLCKTRWIERHKTFETIFELYEYIVITLNEICCPSDDARFYPDDRSWNWDTETKTKANGLRHTFTNFAHIVSFVCAMDLLEPMRPLVTSLQGELMEVYLGFKKIDQVHQSYEDLREDIDARYELMYTKILQLAEMVGSCEERPRVCKRQVFRDNHPSETASQYWKRTIVIPFLDTVCSELQARFSEDKRAHYELVSLIPEVI